MNKFFGLFLCFFLCGHATVWACDVCSAVGGQYPGIFPEWNKPWIQYRFGYQSLLEDRGKIESPLREHYRRHELALRWTFLRRWQLEARLPFNSNIQERRNGAEPVRLQAFGDPLLQFSYIPILTADTSSRQWKHQLRIGGGLQFPFGKDDISDARGFPYAPAVQPGTGAWSLQAHANYILRYKKWGTQWQYSVQQYSESQTQLYQFGLREQLSWSVFYWGIREGWSILPSLGASWERARPDKHIGQPLWEQNSQQLMGNIGLDLFWKRYTLGFQVQVPLLQQREAEGITQEPRLWLHLGYRLG